MRNDFHGTLWTVRRNRSGADDASDMGDTHVLPERMCAFALDFLIVGALGTLIFLTLVIGGLFTFGLAWLALPLCFPLTGFFYNAFTVSGAGRGTWGMRMLGLELVTTGGGKADFVVAGAHAVLFYLSIAATPVLLFALFNSQQRLLHDFATGVVVRRRG
jgi:uncharacterized RDD family membrane protein YckC